MQYELINPSDSYTFIAPDAEVAALVVFSLSTMYAAKSEDGKTEIPIFMFGGGKEWYVEQFKRTPDDGIVARKEELADSLSSFMLGGFKDRKRYNAALSAITDDEKRKEFIELWQDERSSLNDIGTIAHRLAEKLKTKDE